MKSFLEIKYDLVDKLLKHWRIPNSNDSEEVGDYFKYPLISGYLYAKSIKWGIKIAKRNKKRLDIPSPKNLMAESKETLGEFICRTRFKL